MTTTITVISDTHCHKWEEIHPTMREAVSSSDISVHCGDIIREDVVEGFLAAAKKGIIVCGSGVGANIVPNKTDKVTGIVLDAPIIIHKK